MEALEFIDDQSLIFFVKLVITLSLIASGFLVNNWIGWFLRKRYGNRLEKGRSRKVFIKNTVRVSILFLIFTLWASQISGALLSVAAIAGALIITGKEAVLILLGYINISLTKPFRIGDYIEIGNMHGQVIDIDLFSTKLFEIGASGKYSGRLLAIPNSLVFTQTIKHSSALGRYSLYTIDFILPFECDTEQAEKVAKDVAESVVAGFVEEADLHFNHIEVSQFIDLPNASPDIFWMAYSEFAHKMSVRLACPLEKRGDIEQAIYRGFWREFGPVGAPKHQQNQVQKPLMNHY